MKGFQKYITCPLFSQMTKFFKHCQKKLGKEIFFLVVKIKTIFYCTTKTKTISGSQIFFKGRLKNVVAIFNHQNQLVTIFFQQCFKKFKDRLKFFFSHSMNYHSLIEWLIFFRIDANSFSKQSKKLIVDNGNWKWVTESFWTLTMVIESWRLKIFGH